MCPAAVLSVPQDCSLPWGSTNLVGKIMDFEIMPTWVQGLLLSAMWQGKSFDHALSLCPAGDIIHLMGLEGGCNKVKEEYG